MTAVESGFLLANIFIMDATVHGAGRLDKSNRWMCHAQSLVCLSLERGWGVSSENKVVEE